MRLLILLTLLTFFVSAKALNILKENSVCNPDYADFVSRMYLNDRNKTILDFEFVFRKEIKSIFTTSNISVTLNGHKYFHIVPNRTVDMCKLFRLTAGSRFVQAMAQGFFNSASRKLACPLPKGRLSFRGIDLNGVRVPPYFPVKTLLMRLSTVTFTKIRDQVHLLCSCVLVMRIK